MKKTYAERVAQGERAISAHKAAMAEEHGLVGHPKLDKLYELAWSHGHANGFNEVAHYFGEFAELLK